MFYMINFWFWRTFAIFLYIVLQYKKLNYKIEEKTALMEKTFLNQPKKKKVYW